VVTSVIPTAGYVNALTLFNIICSRNDVNPLALNSCHILHMTAITCQLCCAVICTSGSDVRSQDIFTRTVLIEVVHRIGGQAVIDIVADIERQRGLAITSDGVSSTLCLEICEVDDLVISFRTIADLITSGSIGSACVYSCTAGILDFECLCSGIWTIQNQSCLLVQQRIVTNLVYFNTSRLIFCFRIIVGLIICHIDQSHVVKLQQCASFTADEVIVITGTAKVECPFTSTFRSQTVIIGILFYFKFPSKSCPLICSYSRAILPAIPALPVFYFFTSLRSTLQLVHQCLIIQTFYIGVA